MRVWATHSRERRESLADTDVRLARPERGPGYLRATIKNLQATGLSGTDQGATFHGNVARLTGLNRRA